MAMDRQGTGLSILRICIGIFFIFEGLGKIRWLTDTSLLASQLADWSQAVPAGSWSHQYLERVAMPYSTIFARLVPLGEITSGAAMVAGFWTPLMSLGASFMALKFHFDSGALSNDTTLTSDHCPP